MWIRPQISDPLVTPLSNSSGSTAWSKTVTNLHTAGPVFTTARSWTRSKQWIWQWTLGGAPRGDPVQHSQFHSDSRTNLQGCRKDHWCGPTLAHLLRQEVGRENHHRPFTPWTWLMWTSPLWQALHIGVCQNKQRRPTHELFHSAGHRTHTHSAMWCILTLDKQDITSHDLVNWPTRTVVLLRYWVLHFLPTTTAAVNSKEHKHRLREKTLKKCFHTFILKCASLHSHPQLCSWGLHEAKSLD